MSGLRVLLVSERGPLSDALGAALAERGHEVRCAYSVDEALGSPSPDVVVTDLFLEDGCGADILEGFDDRGARPRAVFLTVMASVEDTRRAARLGSAVILRKPFRIEELVEAVEGTTDEEADELPPMNDQDDTPNVAVLERRYIADADSIELAPRDVAAFALRADIGPTCRARVATAVSEIADNTRRHAYPKSPGPLCMRVECDERNLTVRLVDEGLGFDATDAFGQFGAPARTGFARVASLADDFDVKSQPGRGTEVTLRFTAYRVDFDLASHIDLTELDFFTPEISRRVVEALGKEDGDQIFEFSPALAAIVGRMLHGPEPQKALQSALWG